MSAAPSYRQGRRRSPSPLHPSDTSPSVTPTGPAGRRAEPGSCLTLLPWNGYPSTPLPFDTVPFRHYSPEMSALHHIRPSLCLPFGRYFGDNPREGDCTRGTRSRNRFKGFCSKESRPKGRQPEGLQLEGLQLEDVTVPQARTRTRTRTMSRTSHVQECLMSRNVPGRHVQV